MRNGYAQLVKQRASGKTKRRALDDYETPDDVTQGLLRHSPDLKGPILEPAAGTGRMARVLRNVTGCPVETADIKRGRDFLARTAIWRGDIVTNPPYRDGLAERFAQQALKLADGRVCLLFQSGFLWGGKRAGGLFEWAHPDLIVIWPNRIRFLVNGKPIKSQFFSHAWVCWPDRKTRLTKTYDTKVVWASPDS